MSKSTRTNAKLQVIDLTDNTFDFSAGDFTISGFTDNNGKHWFSAKIACENLKHSNVSAALENIPDKDKATIITKGYNGTPVRHLMVTEPGLYRLIFKSRTETAEKYQDWVFDEVLPSIREHGGYISPSATNEQIEYLTNQIQLLIEQKDELYNELAEADIELTALKRLSNAQRQSVHRLTSAEYDHEED